MVSPWEKPEIKSDETENVIREYMEKMTLALENESIRLKEQAEQQADRIIASAREEADDIITQAKQKARDESDNIMSNLKQEAERLLQESREKAIQEGRQVADEIVQEAKDKAAGIITDIIEHGINAMEYDFVRAVSSAKTMLEGEKSRLLNDTSKEVIIVEKDTAEAGDLENILTSLEDSEDDSYTEAEQQETSVNT